MAVTNRPLTPIEDTISPDRPFGSPQLKQILSAAGWGQQTETSVQDKSALERAFVLRHKLSVLSPLAISWVQFALERHQIWVRAETQKVYDAREKANFKRRFTSHLQRIAKKKDKIARRAAKNTQG